MAAQVDALEQDLSKCRAVEDLRTRLDRRLTALQRPKASEFTREIAFRAAIPSGAFKAVVMLAGPLARVLSSAL